MASNVTRDHHRWTRDINAPQDTEIDVTGDLTLDVSGDMIIDVSDGQFTIQDNTTGDPDLVLLSKSSMKSFKYPSLSSALSNSPLTLDLCA